jgi:hypothetical protein
MAETVVSALRSVRPLHITENDFVFKNREGNPIRADKWREKYWYWALRACNI